MDTGSDGGGEMNCSRTHQNDRIVINRRSSIILWVAPLDYNGNVLRSILNSRNDGALRRRWQT